MRSFGDHLRRWRRERSLSQLALAMRADTSARHVSFLESGRSAPGREMVLRLVEALDVSPAERDQALESAGLSPECRRASLSAADALAVERALDTLLDGHGSLPAFVLDANWCLTRCNAGGERLLRVLSRARAGRAGPTRRETDPSGPPNLIELLVAHADTDVIVNWAEVARGALARARAEITRRDDRAPAFDASVEKLAIACASRAQVALAPGDGSTAGGSDGGEERGESSGEGGTALASVVVPFTVDADGTRLSLISMVAQFGGIEYLDVEVPNVELMFAADERTDRWFRSELPETLAQPA